MQTCSLPTYTHIQEKQGKVGVGAIEDSDISMYIPSHTHEHIRANILPTYTHTHTHTEEEQARIGVCVWGCLIEMRAFPRTKYSIMCIVYVQSLPGHGPSELAQQVKVL